VIALDARAAPHHFLATAGLASRALAPVLSRPMRPARVLGVFPTAVYLETEQLVVAVVTQDAVRLPNAVVVPMASAEAPFASVGNTTVSSVGEGSVTIGTLAVHPTRWWDPRVNLSTVEPSTVRRQARTMALLLAGDVRQPGVAMPAAFVDAWRTRDLGAVAGHARALVGLGPGLTPSGDDMLAGMVAAYLVLGGDEAFAGAAAAEVTAVVPGRTTAISATLLRLAATGQVSREAADVLRAMGAGGPLEPAVGALLGVGHTSGADMAAGLLAGAVAASDAAVPHRAPVR
jgi:hypothetical protein